MNRKVALITGAASGIGQALAVAYARCGVAVVGGYYPADPHDPHTTVSLVEAAGGECLMLPLDVGNSASVDALAEQAVQHFGRLDYAVANAGLLRRAPLLDQFQAVLFPGEDILEIQGPMHALDDPGVGIEFPQAFAQRAGLAVALGDEDGAGAGKVGRRFAQGAAGQQVFVAKGLLAVDQHHVMAPTAKASDSFQRPASSAPWITTSSMLTGTLPVT